MKTFVLFCGLVLFTAIGANAQTKSWTYNWTNSGVNFTTIQNGVICYPSTNGITAALATDANNNSAVLWLSPNGSLIRQIKFKDMNVSGFLYASLNSVTAAGYNLNWTKTLIRTWKADGTSVTITNDGLYPSPDAVPSALCDSNFPASFADPRQLAAYVGQFGFSAWTITSTNSAVINHYTLP